METNGLQENRRHGSSDFPVGIYRQQREAGQSILDPHWHAEAEFLAVNRGKAVFQIGLSVYEVCAGEVLFVPDGELHGGRPLIGSECHYSAVVFDLDWLAGGLDDRTSRFLRKLRAREMELPAHASLAHSWSHHVYRSMTELSALPELEGTGDPAIELRIKGGLYRIFSEYAGSGHLMPADPLASSYSRTPGRLKQVLTHIEKNIARTITVSEMADIARMSEGHFSRVFKKYLRVTPIGYINGLRLRLAAGKLRRPGASVSDTALECGFQNFSYFSKLFRSAYRCTPSEYRHFES